MPSTTVIDQLIIKLGLDPRDFTKGEKQVAAEALKTQETVERSSESMGRSLGKLALKWVGVASAVAAVKKVVSVIDDAAERTRRLGIDARNYDIAADRLRNFENAVQMMGGNAEDTRKTVAGLQRAIFDLAYNGSVSDSLVMLSRLGVQFQTVSGGARDFKDIVLDTADAIAKAQQQGMTRASAFQFLQQAGFDPGTANAILAGRGAIEQELAGQQKRFQVTPGALTGAEKTVRSSLELDQQAEALKVRGLEAGVGGIQSTVRDAISHPVEALDKLGDAASRAGTALEDWALQASGTTRGLRNNNPGNIRALPGQRADREGFAQFPTLEEGIRKSNHQLELYASRGINTIDRIVNTWAPKKDKNDVEAYIKDIEKQTGIGRNEVIDPGDRAMILAAMFKHESGKKAPTVQQVADVLTLQDDAEPSNGGPASQATATPPTPAAQGSVKYSKTEVHIDAVNVHTQATDADQMAGDVDGALQRKLMASHAENGVQ